MHSAMQWLRQAGAVVRRVIGAPDYERYLAHMRERHPDSKPVSREQFVANCMAARYDKPGARCC